MNIRKPSSKPNPITEQPDTGRRSFMWKIGTAMSAVLASALPSMARSRVNQETGLKTQVDQLSSRLGILEDAEKIRKLHRTYETYLNNGMYEEVVNMFTNDGQVVFNGGVFTGKKKGIRRLYCDHFKSGLTGKKIDPPPGFQTDTDQQQDNIEVSPDQKSARARFSYSIQVGTPIISDSQLVKMARLQGEGIIKWWEGGIYEVSYVKDINEGAWKIIKIEYGVMSKADYRPGRSYARPIPVPLFSKTYPEDPAGPDRLFNNV